MLLGVIVLAGALPVAAGPVEDCVQAGRDAWPQGRGPGREGVPQFDEGLQGDQRALLALGYGSGSRFADGLMGGRTAEALQRFCDDLVSLGRDAADPSTTLRRLAQQAAAAGDWKARLASAEFKAWLSRADNREVLASIAGREPPGFLALLDYDPRASSTPEEIVVAHAPTDAPSHLLLTAEDLQRLSVPGRVIAALQPLLDKRFADVLSLRNEIVDLLKGITPDEQRMPPLLGELIAEPAEVIKGPQPAAAATPSPEAPEAAPRTPVYGLTAAGLKGLADNAEFEFVDLDTLAALAPLQDVAFTKTAFFGAALEALAPGLGERPRALVESAARKSGAAAPGELSPIDWDGGGCACVTQVSPDDEFPNNAYGLYPYWMAGVPGPPGESQAGEEGGASMPAHGEAPAPPKPQVIDFSVLTRIGYFALTFDARHHLSNPLHWRKDKGFADFVNEAHKHRTRVDLVVQQDAWDGVLGDPRAFAVMREEIVARVTPELDDFLNRAKPWISLGFSPRRTLGDGVTLAFAFGAVAPGDRPALFERFRKEFIAPLKRTFDGNARGALPGDRYYLNLLVPLAEIGVGDGFYRLENLVAIAGHVNLFLIAFDDMAAKPLDAASKLEAVAQMKALRRLIDDTLDPADTNRVLPKMVPVFNALAPTKGEAGEELYAQWRSAMLYTDWNFAGTGVQPLPLDPAMSQALGEAFFTPQRKPPDGNALERWGYRLESALLAAERSVCERVCPERWPVRLGLAVAVLAALGLAIASIWICSVRKALGTPVFFASVFVGAALVLVTLWCDPWWSEHRGMFIALLIAVLAGVLVRVQVRRRRRAAMA